MKAMLQQLKITTNARTELLDITSKISRIISESNVKEGICCVFVPHTTAGVVINENADSNVGQDILNKVNEIVPWEDRYLHTEGNSAAHIKSTLIGNSQMIPIENGRLSLGTWQGVYFCEFDGPRQRKVLIKVMQ
jgi:secondary thiamine-phosphate synthase enzyme